MKKNWPFLLDSVWYNNIFWLTRESSNSISIQYIDRKLLFLKKINIALYFVGIQADDDC